jgi:hypothetical protein
MNKKLQEFIDQVRECDKLIEGTRATKRGFI